MTHRFALPTDVEIENLITRVFESMPDADQSRLSIIESHLLQKTRRNKERNLNKMPWWIVLVLTGGLVTAAWWAGEQLAGRQNAGIKVNEPQSDDKIINQYQEMNELDSKSRQHQEQKEYDSKDSPVIYQRETF